MLRYTRWLCLLLTAVSAVADVRLANPFPRTADPEPKFISDLGEDDPGRWLYSSIIQQRRNELNDAVISLERAVMNSNREAGWWNELAPQGDFDVRAADLSSIYRDLGMDKTVAPWTAAHAVNRGPYANYAPHLLLANTYAPLRDPRRVDQRLDTLWTTEYLLANLLAPVEAGTFSPYFAQPEMLQLGGRPPFAVSTDTEYWSNGSWRETAVLDGRYDRFSYAFEADYRSERGQRLNNDFEQRILSLKTRFAITPEDSVYFQVSTLEASGGDMLQYYNPNDAHPNKRFEESQQPVVLLGYHREWSPGSHTLVLGGRVHSKVEMTDPNHVVVLVTNLGGFPVGGAEGMFDFTVPRPEAALGYEREFESYQLEIQQILETENHSTQIGARAQIGNLEAMSALGDSTLTTIVSGTNSYTAGSSAAATSTDADYQRFTAYIYHQWQVAESWLLSGGVTVENIKAPAAYLNAPVATREYSETKFSPKGGFVWTPTEKITLRAGYSQGIGSFETDQDYRLEPSHIVGFNQSFRNVIPISLTDGTLAAPSYDSWQVSYEQRVFKRTFFGAYGEVYTGDIDRGLGAFNVNASPSTPTAIPEHITYSERDFTWSLSQLIGDCAAVNLKYRVLDADNAHDFNLAGIRTDIGSTLHQVSSDFLFYTECGFFSNFRVLWSQQSNRAYEIDPPGDEFWHFDFLAGYRFPNRKCEVRVGVLNLTDQNYRIAPLNLARELPRQRMVTAQLKLAF